jgi:acyl carrier protein
MHGSAIELRDWLIDEVATLLGRPAESIDHAAPFGDDGLDSVSGLTLAAAIEDHLGVEVDPTIVWDHPSIDALAEFLAGQAAAAS